MKDDFDNLQENDLEQLRKLEQVVRQVKNIAGSHYRLQAVIFLAFLAGILYLCYLNVANSPYRFSSGLTLYYYPKESKTIKKFDDVYVLQILNRQAIRKKFYLVTEGENDVVEKKSEEGEEDEVPSPEEQEKEREKEREEKAKRLAEEERARKHGVQNKIEITYERKRSGRFELMFYAHESGEAIQGVNDFADLCIKEYTEERRADLRRRMDILEQNRADILMDIQRLGQGRKTLVGPLGSVAPENDYNDLKANLNEQQANRSKVNIQILNLKGREKRLQEALKGVKPGVRENYLAFKETAAALKKLDNDLMVARELYTDANPRVLGLLTKKKALQESFDAMLAEHGLDVSEIATLDQVVAMEGELEAVTIALEARQEELQMLDEEIAANLARAREFGEIIPKIEQLKRQEAGFQAAIQHLDESITDINYMMLMAQEDLIVGEYASRASGMTAFTRKNILLAIFGAAGLTFLVAVVMLIVEYYAGKIIDETELEIFPEFRYLGALPATEKAFDSEASKQMTLNTICHRFHATSPEPHVLLVSALPGGSHMPALFSTLEWSYAMEGKRTLTIELGRIGEVSGDEENAENAEMNLVCIADGRGFLPIENPRCLAPTELILLKHDLDHLRKIYDLIFVRFATLKTSNKLPFEQLTSLCDGVLMAAGANKSTRKSVRALLAFHRKTKLPLMTILSGASSASVEKTMNLEIGA